jgi:hypothetical protein
MNHFLLWVGAEHPGVPELQGLMSGCKDVEDSPQVWRGEGWLLLCAAQRGALGAHATTRLRRAAGGGGPVRLGWFGHAWCSEGAHPSLRCLHHGMAMSAPEALADLRERSDGVFAALLFDDARHNIAIGSDLLGSFHVYYRALGEAVAVSNSSAMLAALPPATTLDPVGVQELCSLAVACEERTLWQGVQKLRGGSMLVIDTPTARTTLRAHRPLLAELSSIDAGLDDAVRGIDAAFADVLGRVAAHPGSGPERAGARWAADLTGGNDSRALMAALLRHGVPVAATVSGDADNEDVVIGARLAQIAGIPYIRRAPHGPVTPGELAASCALTDGEFDAVEFAAIAKVHRDHAADGLQISVNGSYGETGRGYPWRLGPKAVFMPDRLAARLATRSPIDAAAQGRDRFRPAVPADLFAADVRLPWSTHGQDMIARLLGYASDLPQCAQLDLVHVDLRMERWQGRIASSTNQLWPAVSPWGFQAVLRRVLTAHPLARRNSLLTRAFTARFAPELADELLFTGNPARPFEWRHAARFLPALGWYAKRARQKLAARGVRVEPPATPSAQVRQPLLCADPAFAAMLAQPALAETRLFDRNALAQTLAPAVPRSDAGYVLWRRLATLEFVWRRHLGLARQVSRSDTERAAAR